MATNGAASNGHAEVDHIFKKDAEKGRVPVHSFDANASPSEKAASAGKARDQLKSVKEKDKVPSEKQVQIDTGASVVVPTITVEDHDGGKPKVTATNTTQSAEEIQDEAAKVPGAMPSTVAPAIPDWYRIGWRQVSGIDVAPLPEGEEKDKGVLDMFLAEQYYGAWYHNAALIVFAVFASHFLTRFHFGWGWLFIVLAFCNTYYSTSMQRVRRHARDDIQRELVKTRLMSEHESADWLNHFLDRFWLIYEPVLSATVIASVEQILSTNTPAFLDSIRMTTFTLGTKAPRIDKVRTFPKTDDDIVMMDWGISFTPNDITDLTPRQVAKKVNPKIVLEIRVGKGMATAAMPILLEDITFSGLMRIRMKLMSNFPHVQVVDISFLEKPVIDYVLKPLGGETFGLDIANVPGLSTFIRDMTHGTLGPMMYDPNVFSLNLEQMLSGKPLDAAIGVIQVTVHSARGVKGTKMGGGTPDPYVSLSINNRAELARTKYQQNTYNPTWDETKYLLINALNESLVLDLYDYNDHRKDGKLSSATFDLSRLLEDSTQEGIVSPLLKDGKERGELRYDISYYPVLEPEPGKEDVIDSTVGIVRFVIHQAKDLDSSKSLSGELNPFTKLYLGDSAKSAFSTPRPKHTNNPVWEAPYEYLCANKETAVVTLKVIDDRDFLKDPIVGYMSIKLTDLLSSMGEAGRDWFPLSGCKTGKVRISAQWKPLSMAGSLHGSEQYTPPIGVIRLLLDKATDVKNVEATLGGKSDPYVRVQAKNVTKGRTEVINNNLNPVWDEIVYIPVHTLKESLMLEVMDYQHLTRDRSLGSVELNISDLAEKSDDHRYPYKSTGKKTAADPIRLEKGNSYKGHLHYTAEFIPALALKGIKFDSHDNQKQRLVGATEDHEEGVVGDGSSMSSSSMENEAIPTGVTIKPRKVKSTETAHTDMTSSSKKTTSDKAETAHTSTSHEGETAETGVEMSTDELLSQQSGIIVFNVISGKLAKKSRLEVLLDDGYWPCFSTVKSRSSNAQWDSVGEGFVKEIDFGQVWLRLNEADEGEKDDVIAEWKGDAKAFLQASLDGPQTYTLHDQDERSTSTVEIEARYIPVPVKLEARESVNNQGILRVQLLDGSEIRGVDRGGKSDPFAVFTLNGQKVFKSQTKKKTLSPEWNEDFEATIPSRVRADFSIEIFDWNQIEQAKSLGTAKIDVLNIEPFQSEVHTLKLVSTKHGEKGEIRVRLLFQPAIIAKSRKNTSTFSTTGRAMTQIGGLPIAAGKGVFHGVTGVFKKGGHDQEELPIIQDVPTGQASQPVGASDNMEGKGASFPSAYSTTDTEHGATQQAGTLRVTVIDAKDLSQNDSKPYVTVRLGDKEFKTKHTSRTATPEWNESFIFSASALTPKLHTWIHDHKTIGKDKVMGEGDVDIWRHIQPHGISSADVFLELHPAGQLRVRLEFDATTNPTSSSSSSASSGEHISRTMSIASPSRFSLRGRRPGAEQDE